jgi:hypothetical protein
MITSSATFDDCRRFMGERGGGCAVCRCEAQAEERFFDALFYENVNDVALRARLRAGNGFCERHAMVLVAYREPLATAILYADLLDVKRRALERWRRRRVGPAPASEGRPAVGRDCPACEAAHGAGRRACEVVAAGLDDGTLAEAWRSSDGLCWPHFAATRPLCRAGRGLLDAVEAERLDRLAHDARALIDSFDYRYTGTRRPEVESAWRRLVAVVVGPAARTAPRRRGVTGAPGGTPGEAPPP